MTRWPRTAGLRAGRWSGPRAMPRRRLPARRMWWRAVSRWAGRSISIWKARLPPALPLDDGACMSIPRPSIRPRCSTRWPMRCICRCLRCGWKRGGWAAGLAARKARAMRWRLPVRWRRGPPGRPARCAMTATMTWSSPASGMICGSAIAPGLMTGAGAGGGVHPSVPLRLAHGSVLAGGRPGDAACRQLLSPARRADRKPPVAHQYRQRHGLSRLWRAAGDDRDRAGDGSHRLCSGG